jgi:hypothetical protein
VESSWRDEGLTEAQGKEHEKMERDLGGVKYTVGLTRPNSGRRADLSTKSEEHDQAIPESGPYISAIMDEESVR